MIHFLSLIVTSIRCKHNHMFFQWFHLFENTSEVVGLSSGRRTRNDNNNMTVEEAGKKGGQKVRKLIQEGKEHEDER